MGNFMDAVLIFGIFFSFCFIGFLMFKMPYFKQISDGLLFVISFLVISVLFLADIFFILIFGEKIGLNRLMLWHDSFLVFLGYLCTLVAFSLVFKYLVETMIDINKMKIYENLQEYTDQLEQYNKSSDQFIRDCSDQLLKVQMYIDSNNLDELKKYYHEVLLPLGHNMAVSNRTFEKLSYIQCAEIKSIVSVKLTSSIDAGIKTIIDITEQIKINDRIDIVDLARVLGIFLDNAIEAALPSEEKYICFSATNKANGLYISIQNSTIPLKLVSPLKKEGTSTKGKGRGIGLSNVDTILKPYKNILWNTKYSGTYFEQLLTLKNIEGNI